MAQDILDQLAPAKPVDPLDAIAPVKKQQGPVRRAISTIMSPIPAVSKKAQELANRIEGVERPVVERDRFEVPDTAVGALKTAGQLIISPITSMIEAAKAAPGAASALIREPRAAARGFAAGVVEGLGDTSPLDIATTVGAGGAGRVLLGRRRSSPGSRTATAAPAAPSAGGPRVRVAPASAPEAYQGARLVYEKVDPASRTMEAKISAAVKEAMDAGKRRQAARTDLPPSESPPMPRTHGRAGGSTQYDPGGNLGHVEDSVRSAVDAAVRAATGRRPPRERKMPAMEKTRVPESARPENRPEAKLSEIDENSTLKEVADAANAVSRREPEVLAPRDPKLEAQAAEMQARPEAPNRAANQALVAETIPGASGKVKRPSQPSSPLMREIAEERVEKAAQVRGSDADVPDNPVARRLEAERQAIERGEILPDIPPEELVPVKTKSRAEMDHDALPDDPAIKTELQWRTEYLDKLDKVNKADKNPNHILTEPERHLWETEGWEAYSKSRGFSDAEIADYKRWLQLGKIGNERGYNPDGPVSKPAATAPIAAAAAKPPALPPMPRTSTAKPVKAAPVAAAEVPVTKVESPITKPVAPVEAGNVSSLSPSEQVQFQTLQKRIPQSTRLAIQKGDKLPASASNDAVAFKRLYDKSVGRGAVERPAVVPDIVPVTKTAAGPKPKYTVEQMLEFAEEAKKNIPRALLEAHEQHKPLPKAELDKITGGGSNSIKALGHLLAYTGWIDKANDYKAVAARAKEVDSLASSNVAAAAKHEGAKPPTPESVVARSEKIAKTLEVPKPATPPEIPNKSIQAAVDEVMGPSTGGPVVRPYITPKDIGPPPKGVDPKLWRTVMANIAEGRRLHKEYGIVDRRFVDVARRFFGVEEAARRLEIDPKTIAEVSGAPHKRKPLQQTLADMDRDLDKRIGHLLKDPKGFLRAEAVLAGAGAAAGGMVGAAIGGEAVEDRLATAISLALIGGLAGYGTGKVASNPKKVVEKTKAAWEELDTANLLLGPAAIKASLGSVGGVSAGIWQRLREGRTADAKRGIKFMVTEAPGMWLNIIKGPMKGKTMGNVGSLTSNIQKQAGGFSTFVLNQVLRPYVAADTTGKTALKRMGFSDDEALRMMMNGEPTSWQGQSLLRVINSTWATRMLAKFPRVRIGSIERGIEFTPGLSSRVNTRTAHKAEQVGKRGLKARAEFGGAALVAGAAYGYFRDPGLMESAIASSITGPAFLPAAAGIAAGRGFRRGGAMRALLDAAVEVGDATPQIADTNIRTTVSGERFRPLRPLKRMLGIE